MANRSVTVTLLANVAGYVAGIKTAAASTREFGNELEKAAARGRADELVQTASVIGTGLVVAFGAAVYSAARFDKEMSNVSAATNATAADLDRLRDAALEAGKSTAFSATQAAQAETELAKAGVAVQDILGGGLQGALDLAAAGQMEVAEAAEVAATAMTQFGLRGRDIPHVADLLAAAAGKAQGDVHDMGMALKMAGLVASQFNISVEETTGTLAAFASAGLLGSDAGTSLKTMLLRLAAPAGDAAQRMEELGIQAYDAQGNFVGLQALAGQLQQGLSGLTQAERDAAMAVIFGADAIRAANVLYREGATGIADWTAKVNDQGFAADVAAKKMDNLMGDLERLKGTLETTLIESGSGASEGLRVLVQTLEQVVEAFGALPGPVQSAVVIIAGISGVTLLAAAGFLKARETAALLKAELIAMGPAGATAATAMSRMSAAGAVAVGKLARLAAILAAAQIASAAFGSSSSRSSERLEALSRDLVRYGETGRIAGEATKALGGDMAGFADDIKVFGDDFWSRFGTGVAETIEGLTGLGSVFDDSALHAKQGMADMDRALADLVSSGHAADAEAAFTRLRAAAAAQGISMRELKKAFPEYFAALSNAKSGTDALAPSTQTLADTFGVSAETAATLSGEIDNLDASLKALHDQIFGLEEAEHALEAAFDEAAEAARRQRQANEEGAGTLDANTKAGRENAANLRDLVSAHEEHLVAMRRNGASIGALNSAHAAFEAELYQTMLAMGISEEAARAYIARLKAIPVTVSTTVNVNTAGAISRLARLRAQLKALHGTRYTAYFDVVSRTNVVVDRQGHGKIPERMGGIVHAARHGRVTPAHVAVGTRVKYAEPETGGEAYIPKFGDAQRSMSILEQAAGWYGGQIDWSKATTGQRGMGGGNTGSQATAPTLSAAVVASAVRTALQGVSVQMDGRAVGVIEGQRADLYARGG